MNYTITLTEAQDKALSFIAAENKYWIENIVHERCRVAIDEIVKICVEKCLENNIQIPASKEEMVILSFNNKWVIPAIENNNTEPTPL